MEDDEDDDDSEIHTVVYFWQVLCKLCLPFCVAMVTVGTGCQQHGLVDIHIQVMIPYDVHHANLIVSNSFQHQIKKLIAGPVFVKRIRQV